MKIEYDGGVVDIPSPNDLGFSSYSELIGYAMIHSDTERALFHPHQVATVVALAEQKLDIVQSLLAQPTDCGLESFVCWRHADDICIQAETNLLEKWGIE